MDALSPKLGLLMEFARDLRKFAGNRTSSAIALVVAGSILEGVGLVLLIPLLGLVFGAYSQEGIVGRVAQALIGLLPASTITGRMVLLLMLFGLLVGARGVVLVKRDTLLTRLQADFVNEQRFRILELLTQSPWASIAKLKHARVSHILGADVHSLRSAAHFLVQSLVAGVLIALQTLLAFIISPPLAAVIIILLVIAAAVTRPLLSRARQLGAEVGQSNMALANSTAEFLSSLKVTLSQNLQSGFLRSFQIGSQVASDREVAFARQRAFSQAVLAGSAAALGGAVLIVSVPLLQSPTPTLVALIVLMARMAGPAMQIQQGVQQIFHSLPAYAHLQSLREELGSSEPKDDGFFRSSTRITTAREIAFHGVTFAHQRSAKGTGGVVDVSLQIPAGAFVGLTGPSGAGKTTFADLLVGLFPPQRGTIWVGRETLEGARLAAWRNSISYVSQDPFLYHSSVRENLLWADPAASELQMWEALSVADAEGLLRRLPAELDTIVGERGTLLSGGERQRIAMARALMRKPALLVLDEATNAVDIDSEQRILRGLTALEPRPTILMIAHRPSSLAFCDHLLELAAGRVIDFRPRLSGVS